MHKQRILSWRLAIFCFAGLFSLYLNAQNITGRITGQVTDSSGAAISDASVTVVHVVTDQHFTATTDHSGFYVIPNVPIGAYSLTVQHPGFERHVQTGITVNVDQVVRINLALTVGQMSQEVRVTAEAPVLDSSGSTLGTTMQVEQISQLPINGRDYARFSLMSPGAVLRSSQIADLTFNGMQSGNNQFSMDGIDATRVDQAYMSNGSERGGRMLTGSLDTVSEFKVQSGNYSAEYGRAAGAYVNIVTKSGTNDFHGGVFEFLRNDIFDARNLFQPANTPAPIRFNNFGGNVGGPIIHNKMFFFANYEGSRQSVGIVGNGTVLSSYGKSLAVPAVQDIVKLMPTTSSTGAFLSNVILSPTSSNLVDSVSFLGINHVQEDTGSIRVDNNWSAKDSSFFRVNINRADVAGPLIGVYPTAFGTGDHQNVNTQTTNLALSETHTFSPRLLNSLLIGMQRYATAFDQSQPFPVITISGLNFSPGNRGLYSRKPTDIQAGDSMTFVKGKHTLKWGATMWRIYQPYEGFSGGSSVTFTSINNFLNNIVTSAAVSPTVPGNKTDMSQVGAYITDTWQLLPNLTLDLGLRWDWNQVPHDAHNNTQVWSNRTNSLTTSGGGYFGEYYGNYAPRIGLAYTVNPKIIFRAGYGYFIEALPIGTFANQVTNTLPGSATLSIANIPNLSYPVTPFVSSGVAPPPSLNGFDWVTKNPKTEQWNASVGIELTKDMGLLIAYAGNHGFNLHVNQGVNYVDPVTGVRPYPQYSNITLVQWTGQSKYNALQISLRRRLAAGLLFDVEYSWAHAAANSADDGLYSTAPQIPYNLKAEWGNSGNDVRHNLSFNTMYALPVGRGKRYLGSSSGLVDRLVSGWNISALGLVRSGVASTVFLGTNTSGNGNTTNQRPNLNQGVNLYVPQNGPSPLNTIPYLNFAAFSLPTPAVPARGTTPGIPGAYGTENVGSFFGPGFAQVDISLMKDTAVTERVKLQFRADIYNILNHPNLDMPSATWTASGATSFGLISNTVGRTIGFGTARQIQLALKLTF
jgi:outer membrane receptor protein involved in Fe transport